MTAMRSFTPPPEYASFRVTLGIEEGARKIVTVKGIGWRDARNKAEEQARADGHYDVIALLVEPAE